MITALYILIYLIGVVVGYNVLKANWEKESGHWTVEDRRSGLLISIISWLVIPVEFIVGMMNSNDNTPAKW